ncbi:MAG TPA: DsbA family oxidoreductase [Roseomonas sp.]|jgi:predicted DsbA family dithiol-disulfide isomerase
MTRPMQIDFVSDISCPWCIIGLQGLEAALARAGDVVDATITFQPFELNPDMAPEGEDGPAHVAKKYGLSAEQAAANREAIRARAAGVGFDMAALDRRRLYNTFDAHRLLHWAEAEGRQRALKHALFAVHFTEGRDVSNHDVLVAAAETAGLDGDAAREVLASGRYGTEVRQAEQLWQARGIQSVPAVIIDGRYLISGGQPPEAFEQALRQIAAEAPMG